MKNLKNLAIRSLLATALCPLFCACSEDDGSFVEPISLYEKVAGNWKLTRIKQVDEIAANNGGSLKEMDLTGFFDSFNISLNVDGVNNPTTYSIGGNAPALLPASGYWNLDRSFQKWDGTPTTLQLFSDAEHKNLIGKVSVTDVPGVSATLSLKLIRSSKGIPFVSYTYTLIPNN